MLSGRPRRRGPFLAAGFEAGDLVDAALVPAAVERRVEEDADDLDAPGRSASGARQREDVGVVVRAAEAGRLEVTDRGGADAGDLVGGDRHADARPADENPAVALRPTRPRAGDRGPRSPGSRPAASRVRCRSPVRHVTRVEAPLHCPP